MNNLSESLHEKSRNSYKNRQTEKQISEKNAVVCFWLEDSDNLEFGKIISRSAKATGKYNNE